MTKTIPMRTELAHRTSDGIDVYLFWNEATSRVTVGVLDARTDDGFELEVDDGTRSTPSAIPTPTRAGPTRLGYRVGAPAEA
jgi:hypothetical protein